MSERERTARRILPYALLVEGTLLAAILFILVWVWLA